MSSIPTPEQLLQWLKEPYTIEELIEKSVTISNIRLARERLSQEEDEEEPTEEEGE